MLNRDFARHVCVVGSPVFAIAFLIAIAVPIGGAPTDTWTINGKMEHLTRTQSILVTASILLFFVSLLGRFVFKKKD